MSGILPIKPAMIDTTVLTFFWVDNFDMNIETQTGHGAINSTHMIAFQEESPLTFAPQQRIEFERSRRRTVELAQGEQENIFVDPKKEPTAIGSYAIHANHFNKSLFFSNRFIWVVIRKLNASDQTISSYSGWCTQVRRYRLSEALQKTVLTYLPPIEAKVTEFSTIYRYLLYLQNLSFQVNMPYVNVTLDVGAAMNAYKLVWNYPGQFGNVLIHLGDFHFMKENFAVIGKITSGSGIEDVIFQANVCSSGSLNGVLCGNHYNRAWTVHLALSEALERLLFERFLADTEAEIPDSYFEVANDNDCFEDDAIRSDDSFFVKYQQFKDEIRDGKLGVTPQFWLCLYIDLMEVQQLAHQAVQENNFHLRTYCWKFFLPLYFALDKTNYARYGSYYVAVLERIESLYPGLQRLLENKGISVQAQRKYPHRVAIDQRGEQTLNREAKTTGGIKNFASDSSGILKWTLNRAEQAKNTNALLALADLDSTSTMYKPLRPSQILKSEKFVNNIVKVVKEEYINPFDAGLDKDRLWNLSSGIPAPFPVAESVVQLRQLGKEAYEEFEEYRIKKGEVDFHSPIKRMNLKLFKSTSRRVTAKSSTQAKCIEANRNILGTLLAISGKNERVVDFDVALHYPLCPVPLSLANPDGSRRTTKKSNLQSIILKHCNKELAHPRESQPSKSEVSTFIIDLMAAIRTLTVIPDTYEELTWKFLKSLPSGYPRVDIVADTYKKRSIKSGERSKRGCSDRIIVQSAQSKVPRNFTDFLMNGENKWRLIELMLETVEKNRLKVLNVLRCTELYFSTENHCSKLTLSSSESDDSLSSNQEEADTKVALHCKHALERDPSKQIVVRSPSGDIDILVILLSTMTRQSQIFLDFGIGMRRKGLTLSDIKMDARKKRCLIGFHAFTGNDYLSSFFRKGKEA